MAGNNLIQILRGNHTSGNDLLLPGQLFYNRTRGYLQIGTGKGNNKVSTNNGGTVIKVRELLGYTADSNQINTGSNDGIYYLKYNNNALELKSSGTTPIKIFNDSSIELSANGSQQSQGNINILAKDNIELEQGAQFLKLTPDGLRYSTGETGNIELLSNSDITLSAIDNIRLNSDEAVSINIKYGSPGGSSYIFKKQQIILPPSTNIALEDQPVNILYARYLNGVERILPSDSGQKIIGFVDEPFETTYSKKVYVNSLKRLGDSGIIGSADAPFTGAHFGQANIDWLGGKGSNAGDITLVSNIIPQHLGGKEINIGLETHTLTHLYSQYGKFNSITPLIREDLESSIGAEDLPFDNIYGRIYKGQNFYNTGNNNSSMSIYAGSKLETTIDGSQVGGIGLSFNIIDANSAFIKLSPYGTRNFGSEARFTHDEGISYKLTLDNNNLITDSEITLSADRCVIESGLKITQDKDDIKGEETQISPTQIATSDIIAGGNFTYNNNVGLIQNSAHSFMLIDKYNQVRNAKNFLAVKERVEDTTVGVHDIYPTSVVGDQTAHRVNLGTSSYPFYDIVSSTFRLANYASNSQIQGNIMVLGAYGQLSPSLYKTQNLFYNQTTVYNARLVKTENRGSYSFTTSEPIIQLEDTADFEFFRNAHLMYLASVKDGDSYINISGSIMTGYNYSIYYSSKNVDDTVVIIQLAYEENKSLVRIWVPGKVGSINFSKIGSWI